MAGTQAFPDFPGLHGVGAGDQRQHATALEQASGEYASIAGALSWRALVARMEVEGFLTGLLTSGTDPTIAAARELGGASVFAAVGLRRWADAIEVFDGSVATLNRTFDARVEERLTTQGNTESYQEVRTAVERQLRPSYERAEDDLRAVGDDVAAMLERGPDSASLNSMLESGEIPPSALGLFAGIEVDEDILAVARARETMDTLVTEGLLDGPVDEDSLYFQWLVNAGRRGVSITTIRDIVRDHDIGPDDFDVLDGLEEFVDRDGKSFFLLPDDIDGDVARRAVLMTYIFNAGTDYGDADRYSDTENDFAETPYSSAEVQRIIDRQEANDWSYSEDVGFVHRNGGRLVTTPNGIMMGLGGNWLQGLFSQKGGTAWGDTFMVNIDDPEDPVVTLRGIVNSGVRPVNDSDRGPGGPGPAERDRLDLDRLLHHEERHSRQWAEHGHKGFLRRYIGEQLTGSNRTEEEAGLADGGY